MLRRTLQACILADNFLDVSGEHNHDLDRTEISHQDFSPIDAPLLVRLGRLSWAHLGIRRVFSHCLS
jgi:hypothetical protein